MRAKGDSIRYGAVAMALHWTIAAAILLLLVLGFVAARTGDAPQKTDLLRVHVVLGVGALVLTLFRAVWWSVDRRPPPVTVQPALQQMAARTVHVLLYLVPILSAVSGIGLVALSGAAPAIFGGAPRVLPRFENLPPMAVHAAAAFALVGLIGLHVAAALFHQTFRRDRIFVRMGLGRAADSRRSDRGRDGLAAESAT